jgi:hypothetical protein
MVRVIKPPHNPVKNKDLMTVFLAGSIEMGAAENWQQKVENYFSDNSIPMILLNPRRDDWDSSWVQEHENPQFYQQVNWELSALDSADVILMYLSPETKSPISLLELGLYAKSEKLVVCCPPGFWRKGNVEIVCARYGIPLYEDLDLLLNTYF